MKYGILLTAALVVHTGPCQPQSTITGPVLGYAWDPAVSALRSIRGIPGSSTLGPALDIGMAPSAVEVSPAQDYGLVVASSAGGLFVADLRADPISLRPVASAGEDSASAPDQIALSPTGSAAALYYSSSRSLVTIRGLPRNPTVASRFELNTASAPLTTMAVDDAGHTVLLAFPDGLYAVQKDRASPLLLLPATGIRAISFLHQSGDALIADNARSELLLIRDVAGAAEFLRLASEQDGISNLHALTISDDDRRVFVALDRAVAVFELAGGPPSLVPCPCVVSGIHRLKGDLFRLNAPSRGPMYLFDATGPVPTTLFVPPDSQLRSASVTELPVPRRRRR